MNLEEKNQVLASALDAIKYIVTEIAGNNPGDVEKQYDSNKAAFDQIAKILANAMRLDVMGGDLPKGTPESARKSKIPAIRTPVGATLAYIANDPELPRLTAILREVRGEEVRGENKDLTPHPAPHTQEIDIYADNTMLAEMTVYRGKDVAVSMVRAALKGAMSRLGRHRRQKANRKLAKLSEVSGEKVRGENVALTPHPAPLTRKEEK